VNLRQARRVPSEDAKGLALLVRAT